MRHFHWLHLFALLLGWMLAQHFVYGAESRTNTSHGRRAALSATAVQGSASWYNRASCSKEGSSGVMANGQDLNDQAFTVASWDYPFGTQLRICRDQRRVCTVATVTDRGPNRRLYARGRIVDLSEAAFQALAPLSDGVIDVTVTPL